MREIQKYFRITGGLLVFILASSVSAQTLDDAKTLYNEGGTAVQEGNIELAVQKFNESMDICSKLYDEEEDIDAESLMISIQDKMPKLYFQLSINKLKEKDINSGLEYAIKAKETANEYGDNETLEKSKELLGKVYYSIALSKYKAEKFDESLSELDKAINESNDLKAHNLKLVILKDQGNNESFIEAGKAAIAAAEAANDLESKEKFVQFVGNYFFNEGVIAKQTSDYEKALKNTLISLDFNPDNADAYFLLTTIYNAQSDWDKAISAAKEGLKYETEGNQARFNYELGNAYYGKGDNAAACEAYSKAAVGEYTENANYQIEHVVKCN